MSESSCTREAGSRIKLTRAHLSSVFVVLVLAAMITLAATKMNLGAASAALSHASLVWVTIATFAVAAAFLARAESWHAAIRAALPDTRIRRVVVARSLLIGVASSTVAPARVGEGVRTWLLSRRIGGQCATILGTVVAQTLLNLVALTLLALVTLTAGGGHGLQTETMAAAIAVPVIVLLALLALSRLLSIGLPTGAVGRDAGIGRRIGCWISRQVAGTGRGLALFSNRSTLLHAGGAQIGAWVLQWFACFAVLMALGLQHQASVATAAAILLAINISAIVPVTPGNVGLFQAACIAVLAPLGISGGHALAYGLLLQGIEISVALALGIPAVLREGLSLRELGRAVGRRESLVVVAAGS